MLKSGAHTGGICLLKENKHYIARRRSVNTHMPKPKKPRRRKDTLLYILINAQIVAPLFWAITIGCPKNNALRIIDEGTL